MGKASWCRWLALTGWVLLTWPLQTLASSAAYPAIPWDNNRQPCWDSAAVYHSVNPWLLYAIAKVESGHNPSAVNRSNRNGTVDWGLMQINSVHFPRLRRYGIDPQQAVSNACASTYIGAWVLADGFRRYGHSWKAIASYNVGSVDTPRRSQIGLAYARKVYAAYDELLRRHGRQADVPTWRPAPAGQS